MLIGMSSPIVKVRIIRNLPHGLNLINLNIFLISWYAGKIDREQGQKINDAADSFYQKI
jgi:hypothetical protein